MRRANSPLVSVVTPFYNTAPYLAECIESVLSQSYSHFEYLLVDNCSTDGSGEIAKAYAVRDPRIRVLQRSQTLSQVQNYNGALAEISDQSQYCKIVQADDFIFPECLQLMVQAGEQTESIGLVSGYWLKGNELRGSGFPYRSQLPGKEVAQLYLRTGVYIFGSPTAVLYRASLVRNCQPFYDESRLHEDTEKCLQILENWDLGFVHQVLSFSRADNESISTASRPFQPIVLDRYILEQRYASIFLDAAEATALKRDSRRRYYRVLAEEALTFRESAFWLYHRKGLETIGETFDRPYLALRIVRSLLGMLLNPGATAMRVLRLTNRRNDRDSFTRPDRSLQTTTTP
jgi:glycosyltransferase involved in cell wall biosynthesis